MSKRIARVPMIQPKLPETSLASSLSGENRTRHAAPQRRNGRLFLPAMHPRAYQERRSHQDTNFSITGELPARQTGMLFLRDGPLAIEPRAPIPLQVRENFKLKARIGRVAAQVMQTNRASALAVKARQNHFATLAMCPSDSRPLEIWRLTK